MVVEFSVKNFRSIKELQTISFAATGLKSPEEYADVDLNNISEEGGMRLLKTIGIYGANGSGKSNIIKALEYFINIIKSEPSSESNLDALCDPFLFQDNPYDLESFFQIVLIIDNKKYRYGFTVKKNTNPKASGSAEVVTSEWLFGTKEKNSGTFFIRKDLEVDKEKLPNSDKIPALPYEHTLFLTHASAFDKDGICETIRAFFKKKTISNLSKGLNPFRMNSMVVLEKENKKDEFLSLLSAFNLKYNDVILEKDPNKPNDYNIQHDKVFLTKSFVRNNETKEIRLNLSYNESAGTQKLFDIAGLIIRAFNMPSSGLILIDEVDSNFHPSLLIKLISLFNNSTLNRSNSQLIFTSHDTNLMSPALMRRDQFYFTEKIEDNSTRVYSLADLRGIRNDADFSKQYLAGFYGALPILESLTDIKSNHNERALES